MRKLLIIKLLIIFFSICTMGQTLLQDIHESPESKIEDFRSLGSPKFQNTWKNIQEGNKYFDSRDYKTALSYYLKANENKTDDCPLNFRIGICYLNTLKNEKAIEFLKKAYEQDQSIYPDLDFNLGILCQQIYKYDIALEYFKLYMKRAPTPEIGIQRYKYVEACKFGKELLDNPVGGKPKNLGSNINTVNDELYPFYYENSLYYNYRNNTGVRKLETYYSELTSEGWSKAKKFNPNNIFKEFKDYRIVYISDDNLEMIIAASLIDQKKSDWNFYDLKKLNGKWNIVENMDWINVATTMYSIAFNKSLDTLYYSNSIGN